VQSVAFDVLIVPATQFEHTLALLSDEYDPAAQMSHAVTFGAPLNDPAAQAAHALALLALP